MITDLIVGWFYNIVDFLLGVLPDTQVPSWLDASGPIATVFGYAGQLGVWVPIPLLVTVLTAILLTWGIGFGIKVVRIIASFFTAGGGSAA